MSSMSGELPAIPDKHIFKIGEVARLVGVKTHVLRFWEREFTSIRPRKGRNGHRQYSRTDVEQLRRVRCLLHERGMTIVGARALLKDGREAVDAVLAGTPAEAAEALQAVQAEQTALTEQVEHAQTQLKTTRRALAKAEEEAKFWRNAAHSAEQALAALRQQILAEADRLDAVLTGNRVQ
jgi:DNA-binding transcriptional MerR regulator